MSSNPNAFLANVRITLTLVALILMFTVLMSPSELLHFYSLLVKSDSYRTFEVATHVTNILQALNFAFHFVLYCVVNVTFRRTIIFAFYVLLQKCGFSQKEVPHFTAMSKMNASRNSVAGNAFNSKKGIKYCPKKANESYVRGTHV